MKQQPPAKRAPETKGVDGIIPDETEIIEPIRRVVDRHFANATKATKSEAVKELATVTVEAVMVQGPLPPPHMAEAYERLCPGFVDRSIRLVENQQQAQIDSQSDIRNRNDSYRKQGLWVAAIVTLSFIVGGILLMLVNPDLKFFGISSMFFGPLLGLIGVFIRGRPLHDIVEAQKKPKG
jgi:uncharacterized membrane protein